MIVRRVGEASHPGPAIRTTFDDPEVDDTHLEHMEDFVEWLDVEADGIAVGNEGWTEFDVEASVDNAKIPAYLYYDMAEPIVDGDGAGFRWPTENIGDCPQDELEAMAHGAIIGAASREPPTDSAARQLQTFHERHGHVGAEPSIREGVALPIDLEQQFAEEDRVINGRRYEKWATFFSTIAASREAVANERAMSARQRRCEAGTKPPYARQAIRARHRTRHTRGTRGGRGHRGAWHGRGLCWTFAPGRAAAQKEAGEGQEAERTARG